MAEINIFQHSTDAETVEAGAVLFSEGEPGDFMVAVVEGEVELSHNGAHLETLGAGTIVGEMALVDSSARSATATARTQARIVRVDQRRFVYLVHEHPTFALQVMSVMAERLRKANDAAQ